MGRRRSLFGQSRAYGIPGRGCPDREKDIPLRTPRPRLVARRLVHFGPLHGTNNIGEFLAIVHALALMEQRGVRNTVIYSDSVNAQIWVRNKKCKTTLKRDSETEQLYDIIQRAETWLKTHTFRVPILKWDTKEWGEIPADFGRKK